MKLRRHPTKVLQNQRNWAAPYKRQKSDEMKLAYAILAKFSTYKNMAFSFCLVKTAPEVTIRVMAKLTTRLSKFLVFCLGKVFLICLFVIQTKVDNTKMISRHTESIHITGLNSGPLEPLSRKLPTHFIYKIFQALVDKEYLLKIINETYQTSCVCSSRTKT